MRREQPLLEIDERRCRKATDHFRALQEAGTATTADHDAWQRVIDTAHTNAKAAGL